MKNNFKYTQIFIYYGLFYGFLISVSFGLGAFYLYISKNWALVLMKTITLDVCVIAVLTLLGLLLDILETFIKKKRHKKRSKK